MGPTASPVPSSPVTSNLSQALLRASGPLASLLPHQQGSRRTPETQGRFALKLPRLPEHTAQGSLWPALPLLPPYPPIKPNQSQPGLARPTHVFPFSRRKHITSIGRASVHDSRLYGQCGDCLEEAKMLAGPPPLGSQMVLRSAGMLALCQGLGDNKNRMGWAL